MRPSHKAAALFTCLAFLAFVNARGCSSGLDLENPFERDDPVVEMRAAAAPAPARATVVAGVFENPPQSPLAWQDIGAGYRSILQSAMMDHPALTVQAHDGVSGRIAAAVLRTLPQSERDAALSAARREFPEVDYVIVGRVLEFHHSADVLPIEARRTVIGPSNEAVVRIEAFIVDLPAGRITPVERIVGTADAPEQPTAQQYRYLSMTSSLFPTSPLGRAAAQSAAQIVERLDLIAPARVIEMQVLRAGNGREIIVNGGRLHGVTQGQRYFICRRDHITRALTSVQDHVMRTDLTAEVMEAGDRTSTLWLLGEPPPAISLRDCVVTRERP